MTDNYTIRWFKKLPLNGKLYTLYFFTFFPTIFITGENTYEYSVYSFIAMSLPGLAILVDTIKYVKSTGHVRHDAKNKALRYFGVLIPAVLFMWLAAMQITIVMNYTNTLPGEVEVTLDSYWRNTSRRRGGNIVCLYMVEVTNERDETDTFCVDDLPDHRKLKGYKLKNVVLEGRGGWLGFVVDDIRLVEPKKAALEG